jgi:Holliday junction resolvase RusA-like endonuclease
MLALTQTKQPLPRFPKEPVHLEINFYPPDRRRRDPTNLLKSLLDGLEGVVYRDDKQIVKLSWENVGVSKDNPRVEIRYGVLQ